MHKASAFQSCCKQCPRSDIWSRSRIYSGGMGKHLVDIDEKAMSAARAEIATATIEETVNSALHLAASGRDTRVAGALDVLADAEYQERSQAWR